ncbi:unnamed protein product [Trichobilharzia regenti]|nr:unnamed protein product [Trichobilharzia regenti]
MALNKFNPTPKIWWRGYDPNHTAPVYNVPGTNFKLITTDSLPVREKMLNDFVKRCKGIIEVGLQWAPNLVRSHLINYMLELQHPATDLTQHTGLALATESVLNYAGYNRAASFLGVIHISFNSPFTFCPFNVINCI